MAELDLHQESLANLRGKVVLVTGMSFSLCSVLLVEVD